MSHVDGSECKEGTQKVPENFKPCCKSFLYRTSTCHFDIRIEYYINWWGIVTADGVSYIIIDYCPFCGAKLEC